MTNPLKLVILYDAKKNVYTVSGHNLSPEEADKVVAEYRDSLILPLSVNQQVRHRKANPDDCQTCQREVASASGLVPKPTFQRRNKT